MKNSLENTYRYFRRRHRCGLTRNHNACRPRPESFNALRRDVGRDLCHIRGALHLYTSAVRLLEAH